MVTELAIDMRGSPYYQGARCLGVPMPGKLSPLLKLYNSVFIRPPILKAPAKFNDP